MGIVCTKDVLEITKSLFLILGKLSKSSFTAWNVVALNPEFARTKLPIVKYICILRGKRNTLLTCETINMINESSYAYHISYVSLHIKFFLHQFWLIII